MRGLGRNPATPAGLSRAEQERYESGYERTFRRGAAPSTKRRARRGAERTAAQKRASRREAVRRKLVATGVPQQAAARRAMRQVPFTKSEKGKTYQGLSAYTGKAKRPKPGKRVPKQYAERTVVRRKKVTTTRPVKAKKRVRVAYGRFKRARVTDPRTGRKRASYMYRDTKGRFRKIPAWAIAGAPSAKAYRDGKYDRARSRIAKRRTSAARRIERSGGPFTPNRSRSRTMKANKRRTKASRRRAALKGWARKRRSGGTTRRTSTRRRRMRRNASPRRTRRAAAAATPNRRRRTRRAAATPNRRRRTRRRMTANRGFTSATARKASRKRWRRTKAAAGRKYRGRKLRRGYAYYKGKKPRSLRGRKRTRKLPKARIYLTNKSRKRSLAAKKGWRRRRRMRGNQSTALARRSRTRRAVTRRRRASSAMAPNRRRRRKKSRRGGKRRSYRRNQFMAQLRQIGTSALFVTTGFLAHKALTHLICNQVIGPMLKKSNGNGAVSQYDAANGKPAWAYIGTGFLVALAGIGVANRVAKRYRVEIGAGMLASFFHTTIVTLLSRNARTKGAAGYLAGYASPSRAAAIGRWRRRGMRGMGAAPQTSILPRYVPTGRSGGIQQAVAQAGMGEYFQAQGVGEYFASGVQGIGQYEPAGPMVTQAAAGFGQIIEDGIRPDENMDDVLTLAEAQAGMGSAVGRLLSGVGRAGLGEFYTADRAGNIATVPQRSQWVPNNPLWAGTKPAQDRRQTSELPAGILQTPGGNGIFA